MTPTVPCQLDRALDRLHFFITGKNAPARATDRPSSTTCDIPFLVRKTTGPEVR
jgi:hypothetical protein